MNPASKTTGPANRLTRFGQEIERARKSLAGQEFMTQGLLSKALEDTFGTAKSQSYVARLERGLVNDPDPAVLKALADILDLRLEALVGLIIQDKYGISEEAASSLLRNPLTLTELAKWESEQNEVWVVATRFVDNHAQAFKDAVLTILRRGGRITFFLPEDQVSGFRRYMRERLRAAGKREDDQSLRVIELEEDQAAVMATSYVIVNGSMTEHTDTPGSASAKGYLILNNQQGEPACSLELFPSEVMRLATELRYLLLKTETRGSGADVGRRHPER